MSFPLSSLRRREQQVNYCRIVQSIPHALQEAPQTSLLHIAASEALRREPRGEVRENLATICDHRGLKISTMEGGPGCGKSEFVIRLLTQLLLGLIQVSFPNPKHSLLVSSFPNFHHNNSCVTFALIHLLRNVGAIAFDKGRNIYQKKLQEHTPIYNG